MAQEGVLAGGLLGIVRMTSTSGMTMSRPRPLFSFGLGKSFEDLAGGWFSWIREGDGGVGALVAVEDAGGCCDCGGCAVVLGAAADCGSASWTGAEAFGAGAVAGFDATVAFDSAAGAEASCGGGASGAGADAFGVGA
jgi:hypothetical protein